jgi:hypothetical protein
VQQKPTSLIAVLIAALVMAPLPCAAQDRYAPAQDRYGPLQDGYGEPPRVSGLGGYGNVPGAPTRPMEAARPAAWPGTPVPPDSLPAWPGPPAAEWIPFERARMVARVGADAILVSDLQTVLEEMLDKNLERLAPEQSESQRKMYRGQLLTAVEEAAGGALSAERLTADQQQRKAILQQLLKEQISLKLVFNDARKKIPSENFPNVEKQFNKQFEQFELKKLMSRYQAESWRDLDQALRARGTSFDRVRRESFERNLFQQWLRQQVKFDEEITLEQMRTYYREHPTEFDKTARTRWQMLAVPISSFIGKDEARAAIGRMGNQVIQGADLTAVAKSPDSGSDGDVREWPDKERRIAPAVEKAIVGLPAGQMSPILEDGGWYYIVRVVERIAAHRQSFEEAQGDIREKIKQQRTNEQMQAYLTRLREQIPVWTILDEKPAANRAADRRTR